MTPLQTGPALSDLGAKPQRDGRWWVFPSGYRCPVVAGGSGGQGQSGNAGGDAVVDPPAGGTGGAPPAGTGDPAAGGSGPAGQGAPGTGAGAGLTQADVDRAARDAKKAAAAELATALGCSVDEAKTIIAERRQAQDAEKTEAQRAREAADAEKASAAAEKAAAAAERRSLRVERALVAAKVKDDRSTNAARLVLADLADDADEAAITAAVETFKTETPEWFGESAAPPPPGSDPHGRGPGGGAGGAKTGIEAGRQRAIDRKNAQPAEAADPLGNFAKV